MPTYEYHCEANGRTVEVRHGMSEKLGTWGELCERAEIEAGDTPAETPIERLVSLAFAHGSSSAEQQVGCGKPSCCMLNN